MPSVLRPYPGHCSPHSPVAHSEEEGQEEEHPMEQARHTHVHPDKPEEVFDYEPSKKNTKKLLSLTLTSTTHHPRCYQVLSEKL